ncbi:hypothetical protein D9757_013743 [Collybiopsis confluens]|uniref:Uncharacterized protein n=1 Tax=Collybiopsis confluens TaxID=2823264 RepID=A0A8H5CUD2_9AGAR|nr:hypothetical protein D9757_013743 [Collybiopsis confluens]
MARRDTFGSSLFRGRDYLGHNGVLFEAAENHECISQVSLAGPLGGRIRCVNGVAHSLWSDSTIAVVDKLILWAIETGVVTSLVGIALLICFLASRSTYVWVALTMILPKIFSNAMLANMNSRVTLRQMQSTMVVGSEFGIQMFWKNDPDDGTDEEFWSHKWDTHGTCYSTLRPTCLPSGSPSGTDTLPTYTWLANQGITPSSSTTHTLTSLENALAAEAGVKPMLTCSGNDLNQIAWYFNLKGSLIDGVFAPIDSPEASSCPPSGILYPPKTGSPVSTTSPTGTSTSPVSTGTPGTLPANAQIHAMQSGTQVGGLLTLGTWSTQTLATMTLSGTSSSFTMTSSKGSCGVSGGTLACGSGVTATTFSAATSGGNLFGETVETVFTGTGQSQLYTLAIVST